MGWEGRGGEGRGGEGRRGEERRGEETRKIFKIESGCLRRVQSANGSSVKLFEFLNFVDL
jgi:hypothetical protein